jgi:hypothetical protein
VRREYDVDGQVEQRAQGVNHFLLENVIDENGLGGLALASWGIYFIMIGSAGLCLAAVAPLLANREASAVPAAPMAPATP